MLLGSSSTHVASAKAAERASISTDRVLVSDAFHEKECQRVAVADDEIPCQAQELRACPANLRTTDFSAVRLRCG